MAVLTFQYLRELQKKERDSPGLQTVDSSFYKALSECLKNSSDENTIAIIRSIFDMRERKIVSVAIKSARADIKPSGILPEEEPLFREVCNAIKNYRNITDKMLNKEEVPPPAPAPVPAQAPAAVAAPAPISTPPSVRVQSQATVQSQTSIQEPKAALELIKVRVLLDIPAFVGGDMKTYGPLKAGETAEIPKKAAEILVNAKSAELLRER